MPLFTPKLSSHRVAPVTPVEPGLIQPLVDGLGAEMLVGKAPLAGVIAVPMGFDATVKASL